MLLVSTTLKPSPIQGLGCFTNVAIKKGEVVWVLDERLDLVVPEREAAGLPAVARDFLCVYAYACELRGERVLVLCGDHSKHMNHSDDPNCIGLDDAAQTEVAARDIAAGEELTCDYYSFDLEAATKLGGGVCAPNL